MMDRLPVFDGSVEVSLGDVGSSFICRIEFFRIVGQFNTDTGCFRNEHEAVFELQRFLDHSVFRTVQAEAREFLDAEVRNACTDLQAGCRGDRAERIVRDQKNIVCFSHSCDPRRVGFTKACFIDGTDAPFPLEGGNVLPLRHEMFDDDAIVLKDMAREVTLESDDGPALTVRYPDFSYLGIWHRPHTDAPYVCIEPWAGFPSYTDEGYDITKKEGMNKLDSGAHYINTHTVYLK